MLLSGLILVGQSMNNNDVIVTDAADQDTEPFLSPLYLTFVMHTEEDTSNCRTPKANNPDYDGDEALMLHFSDKMRKFGQMVASHGAKISFGTDWTFSRGVEAFDPTFYTDMEAMGHEIDSHAHASCILYEEVREDIISAGGNPTPVVSGINEDEIYNEFGYFDRLYPDFSIFWGVASPGHGEGEEMTGWVWRPSSDNWIEHDPDGDYIHIGHGDYANSIEYIVDAIENRKENAINTYAVFMAPRELRAETGAEGIAEQWTVSTDDCTYWENKLEWWDEFFTELDQYKKSGEIEYASLTEIADVFVEKEDSLIIDQSDIPRSDESMTDRNKSSGYCMP